jgi:hypothetical protein
MTVSKIFREQNLRINSSPYFSHYLEMKEAHDMVMEFYNRASKFKYEDKVGFLDNVKKFTFSVEDLKNIVEDLENSCQDSIGAGILVKFGASSNDFDSIDLLINGLIQNQDRSFSLLNDEFLTEFGPLTGIFFKRKFKNFLASIEKLKEKHENENFENELGGISHQTFSMNFGLIRNFKEMLISQQFIENQIFLYLAYDKESGHNTVIFSNDKNLELNIPNSEFFYFDRGQGCCPPQWF